MKRITFLIDSMSGGGAEHQLAILANELVKDYEISIITFCDIDDHYCLDPSIKRIRLGYGKSKSMIYRFLLTIVYLWKVKTDVVITYGQRSSFLSLLTLWFRKNIKVIASERNLTTGKPGRYESILFSKLYMRASFIVPNSYSQARYIISKKPELENKIITITNYTDLKVFTPAKNETLDNSVIKIAVFARYHKQKNFERFAKAIKRVRELTDKRFVVNWYGRKKSGSDKFEPYYIMCEDIIRKEGLSNVIYLNDQVREIASILNTQDVICLPSLFEGFSNSISEAICCGKPMLVSDVSDNSIMVKDGENGILFDPLNIEDMAECIAQFLELPESKKKKMGERSREIAESLFDLDHFTEQYVKLIEI